MLSPTGHYLGAHFLRLILALFMRRCILGKECVPRTGAAILAPNHISHFDPPLLGISSNRPVDWMAMEELFRSPTMGALVRWFGAFPVHRGRMDQVAIRTAIERLERGRMVGVFPEGGLRTGPNSVLEGAPIKPGVSGLAQMTQVPVVPCCVIGTDALYNRRSWLPWHRTKIWFAYAPPLDPPSPHGDKAAARVGFDQLLGERIRELYHRTIREQKIPSDRLPQTPQKRKGRE